MDSSTIVLQEHEKGEAALLNENYQQAITHFTNAINISNNNGVLFLLRGKCYYKLNKDELAIRDLEGGIQKIKTFLAANPNLDFRTVDGFLSSLIDAFIKLGFIAEQNDQLIPAFNRFTEAIRFYYIVFYPESLPEHVNVCDIFMYRGKILIKMNFIEEGMKDMGYALAEATGNKESRIRTIALGTGNWNKIDQARGIFFRLSPPDRWNYIKDQVNNLRG